MYSALVIDDEHCRYYYNLIISDDRAPSADYVRVWRGPVFQFLAQLSTVVVGIDADYLNSAVRVTFRYFDQMRELRITCASIGMPEMKNDDLSGKILKRQRLSVGSFQFKPGRVFTALYASLGNKAG